MPNIDKSSRAQVIDSSLKNKQKLVVHSLLIVYGLVLTYIIGALVFTYQPPVGAFFGLSFVLLFFAIGQCLYEIGINKTIIFIAITVAIGYGVEVLGANTGFLFGKYTYGNSLGEKVFGVPIVVPLVWFVIVFITYSLTFSSLSATKTSKITSLVPLVLLATFGTVAWDFLVDPLFSSSQYGYWTWQINSSTPQLSGVPLSNFVGWSVVSFVMLAFFIFFSVKYVNIRTKSFSLIQRPNTIDSQITYALLMIDGAIANEILGHSLVVVIGLITMSSFLLATSQLGRMQKKTVATNEEETAKS